MDTTTEDTWNKAMAWWKNSPHSTTIRKLACDRMIKRGCEEIGSSDINHQVYSMWQDWERSKDQYPTVLLFLVDYANN